MQGLANRQARFSSRSLKSEFGCHRPGTVACFADEGLVVRSRIECHHPSGATNSIRDRHTTASAQIVQPVLNDQVWHSGELAQVVRDNHCVQSPALRSDPVVVCANGRTDTFQFGAEGGVVTAGFRVDGRQRDALGDMRKPRVILVPMLAFFGAQFEFAEHDGRKDQVCERRGFKFAADAPGSFHRGDEDVGVEQVGHFNR